MPFVNDVDSPEVLLEWQHKAWSAASMPTLVVSSPAPASAGQQNLRAFELARCVLAAA